MYDMDETQQTTFKTVTMQNKMVFGLLLCTYKAS